MAQGDFLEDLFYGLGVFPLYVPPLRDRMGDILPLAEHFLDDFSQRTGKSVRRISTPAIDLLSQYHWPGNVRELENMVKRMVVLGNERSVLQEISLKEAPPTREPAGGLDLEALGTDLVNGNGIDLKAISKRAAQIAEKRVIERVLQQTRWNRKEAAERLQISYKALLYKMKEAGLGERD